jgi:hypothetical protein
MASSAEVARIAGQPVRWRNRRLLFEAKGQRGWLGSHAALPVVDRIEGDRYRVYVSSRDRDNRSQIGYFEVDLADPSRIVRVSDAPVLTYGALGAFDDAGVTSACLITHASRKYLYYSGWSLGVSVPFYFYVGLAVSDDGGESFQRVSPAPILERASVDPYLTASPWVLVEEGVWHMWYVSGTGWKREASGVQHHYHIKYACSSDGVDWRRDGTVCIDYASAAEYAMSRPTVVRTGEVYRMWFAARGAAYRLAYAESTDRLHWRRDDARAGLEVSRSGWDCEMVAYPCVIHHGGAYHMFYNGNDYGRSGVGYAILEE